MSQKASRIQADFEAQARVRKTAVQRNIDLYIETLHSISGFYAAGEHVDRKGFHVFTRRALSHFKDIQALEWAPRVLNAGRNHFEQLARRDGFSNFLITEQSKNRSVKARVRAEYFPISFVEPYKGNETAMGNDLASSPARLDAINRACRTGDVVATGRTTLIKQNGWEKGFLILLPIYRNGAPHNTIEQRQKNLSGFVVGVFRFRDLVGDSLRGMTGQGIDMSLYDESAPKDERLLFTESLSKKSDHTGRGLGPQYSDHITVGQRRWLVEFDSTSEYIAAMKPKSPWIAFICGLFLTAAVSAYVYITLKRAREIELLNQRLADANKDLGNENTERRRAENELRQNEQFLEAVFEGIQDGISVLNTDMTIARINHAAKWLYYGTGAAVGKKCYELVHQRTTPCDNCPAVAALELGTIQSTVVPLSNEDRKDGWMEFVAFPLFDDFHKVRGVISYMRDITEKKLFEERMEHLAHHDVLTNLPNRRRFSDSLEQDLRKSKQRKKPLAVLFIDIDRFKVINDTLGHNTGDLLLRHISEALQAATRQTDTVARMGGDEFTVVLSDVTSKDEVGTVAQRILKCIARPITLSGHELFVTASIGVSVFPSDGKNVEELIKNADTAMYKAKEEGRDNFQFYSKEFDTMTVDRMKLQNCLRKAIDQGEMMVHYQPQLNMRTNRIEGVEALIRWFNPEMGLIMPDKFIPLAEESGFIADITRFVMETACAQSESWKNAGFPEIKVAVNVSGKDIQRGDLADIVTEVLQKTGLPPHLLELEITESALVTKPDVVADMVMKLKQIGTRVSIDDFGTRYASLSTIKQFPVDCIKIDRLFVRHVTTDSNDAAIVDAIISMAHNMGLDVVAEGIETLSQFQFLQNLKCDRMQGYLLSRPVPPDELTPLLKEKTIGLRAS